ncbi:sulfite exporter TauE/SafE family protein [Salinisphaera sp. Q1T1-3]|uniref:sulfite exporter TauE/SafE family protein n=1 Tax=Salinisphaera sp. Q1T1-3 TaxID=2321229 RepID=UPI000E758C2F|nr:sulfite exporter TauE/SafE family protein [Salinisphaera sp. Q1T1-3]RJS91349.1 sulfite exporter TauE/SafE family protein [Salinisphaera sp. Q1T1-3]
MQRLVLFGIAGFIAQLVDGAIGMGYGLTSSSILLAIGITPAVASASIHLAEVATTAASGVSHYRFGNVDTGLVKRMMGPGAIGAFAGAVFLTSLPGDAMRPFVASFLLILGFYVVTRYLLSQRREPRPGRLSSWTLVPMSLVAGFFDSIGGGGWGPIATPTLLAQKRMDPRKVVGSVDTSEFAITIAGTFGFLLTLGIGGVNWLWVGVFAASGLAAAPVAAAVVRYLPSDVLAAVVGGAIIMTNARTLMHSAGLDADISRGVLIVGLALWATLVLAAVRQHRQARRTPASSNT